MQKASDTSLLETLARDTRAPINEVFALYQRELDALSQDATITNYLTLLALRRVRHRLLETARQH